MVGRDRLSYCAEQVRRHDRDRYLTALYAPSERREALFALYAFNLEIAKTREVVTEPLLGEMRLRWWSEALEALSEGRPPGHPVAEALAEAVARFGLSRDVLGALVEARHFDLRDEAPRDLAALESYAEASSAALVLLALELLGAGGAAPRAAGRYVGIAWALSGLLRAVPFHARARRCFLPRESLARAGLAVEDLYGQGDSAALAAVVAEVAEAAHGYLGKARALGAEVPRAALPALLPAALADADLARLARAGHHPFRLGVGMGDLARQWRLLRHALRGRF